MINKIIESVTDKILKELLTVKYSKTEIALDYVMRYSGRWYIWGGDDPTGFDCSGLALEYLKARGSVKINEDYTAQQLAEKYQRMAFPRRGALVYYGKDEKHITHVQICLSEQLALGSNGGTSKIKTAADAQRYDAFINVRPIHYRSDIVMYNYPYELLQ